MHLKGLGGVVQGPDFPSVELLDSAGSLIKLSVLLLPLPDPWVLGSNTKPPLWSWIN